MKDAEQALLQHWRLQIGPDSKMVVSASPWPRSVDIDEFKALSHMRCLGHHISSSCTIAADFQANIRAIWGAYWLNAGDSLRRAGEKKQARFMNSSLRSIAGFRWSRWPWQRSYADRLDGAQRHIIACMRPVRAIPGESLENYTRRRRLLCSQFAERWGKWSTLWARDVLSWDSHITRARDLQCWNKPLRDWHDGSWLQRQRVEHSGRLRGRTGTRAGPGHPATRWQEGVVAARNYLTPSREFS